MRRQYKRGFNVGDTSYRDAIVAAGFKNRPLIRYDYRMEAIDADMRLICLGPTAYIKGKFMRFEDEIAAHVDYFILPRALRGHGFGKLLFQAMVLAAKEYGASTLHSDEVSNDALRVRWSLFGDSPQQFYDTDIPLDGDNLPFTLDQAMLTNDLVEASWQQAGPDDWHASKLGIVLDLDSVDTSCWAPLDIRVRNEDPTI